MRFSNKTVIVSGAFGGIGRACALEFAAEGASLVLADLTLENGAVFLDELSRAGARRVETYQCDVATEVDVINVCEGALNKFGRIDTVVNIAGMMIYKPIEDLSYGDWMTLFSVNFMGAAIFTRQAFKAMKPGGTIVNVSSIHAHQTSPLVGPYAAAKAALCSLTRTASIEGRAKGIRVNAVLPGAVDTSMLWASPNLKSCAETLEPGDIGRPSDIAKAVFYLASEDSSFITGTELTVDGGRLAKL